MNSSTKKTRLRLLILLAYLVLQTSFVTTQQPKAHKSMEAYNQFVSGWVQDVYA